jgi:hypothetical protein
MPQPVTHFTCSCTDGRHAVPARSVSYRNRQFASIVARHTGRHVVTDIPGDADWAAALGIEAAS